MVSLGNGRPGLSWLDPQAAVQRSADGYRVTAIRLPGGWRFSAWAPPELPALNYWQWQAQTEHRASYAIGESPPQRVALLGVFATAEQARHCCQLHHHEVTSV